MQKKKKKIKVVQTISPKGLETLNRESRQETNSFLEAQSKGHMNGRFHLLPLWQDITFQILSI